MNTFYLIRLLALTAACGVLALAGVRAEQSTSTVKFSDPSKPGTLKISLARGDVHIAGADSPEVVVKSESEAETKHREPRQDGLRVLTEAASFSLNEKDNVVTLDALSEGWMGAPSNFQISVPKGTNVIVANSLGGSIECKGIAGDVEIKSLNGEVRLDNVVGGALVDTTNGEIDATITELHDNKPLSFTSMNGSVVLRVPATAKANVRLRTQNGAILTDFDEKTLATKVEAMPSRYGRHAVLTPEAHAAVREAARAGAEAVRHAAEAIKEAAEAAREGAEDVADDSPGQPGAPKHPTRIHVGGIPGLPPMPPMPPIPALTGGRLVTGALNGGGVEISVATMNGDVTVRQLK